MPISTGFARLDAALSGGLPAGVTVLSGETDSCKSLLGNTIAALNCGLVIFTAGNPDPYGFYPNGLLHAYSGEAALSAAIDAVRKGIRFIFIDSIAGILSAADQGALRFRSSVSTQRLLYHGFRELNFAAQAGEVAVLAANEMRIDIREFKLRPFMPHIVSDPRVARLNITAERGIHEHTNGVLDKVGFILHIPTSTTSLKTSLKYVARYPHGLSTEIDKLMFNVDIGILTKHGAYWRETANGATYGPGLAVAAQQWGERCRSL